MTDQCYEFIHHLRQLIENIPSTNEDNDSEPGGTLLEQGDITFVCKTSDNEIHSKHTLDNEIYQQVLKFNGCQLLDVYNSNALYQCTNKEIKENINGHMERTKAYICIDKISQSNNPTTCVQGYLNTIIKQMSTLLNDLLKSHCINESQFHQMNIIEQSKVRMDYLFYLPDIRQRPVSFHPIMVCSSGPTIGIARYIHRLLQPIYDQVALSTTFFKESDVIHALESYANHGSLLSTTLFATISIQDLDTTISHDKMMQTFERFLNEYYQSNENGAHQFLTIHTILKLVDFILQNQIFIFKNKIYRQVKGSASQSPLTSLLMNIYMFYWQEDLKKIVLNENELFGRCYDKIFLTWNGSKKQLRSLLYSSSSFMKIKTSIGQKITYMDAQIGYINGCLQTKINHNEDTKSSGLPYILGHSRYMYSTLMRACLIRAVLCCSNVHDFYYEQKYIEEKFHSNGYSGDYIHNHVEEFFKEFNASQSKLHLDQLNYEKLRESLFEYDKQQLEMKIKQRKDEQNKEKWYISSTFEGETLHELQENFQKVWKTYLDDHVEFSHISIEIITQSRYPSYTK
ncbi:unnamed protein product [Adineta ricciae]|uniref:Helix-turn-helix domain-containing protein n=1 Tax=Adineta ricciae TaxID=249248 RepID=A0A814TD55_ADIRI|nr:unnamed protein product [Adineta ricciae]CAF1529854.1 unnamed protein product [Adineta ricciae]